MYTVVEEEEEDEEEDEAGECCVTFYGSTGPVPGPLMFSNFTRGRAPGIQGPRDTYVISLRGL